MGSPAIVASQQTHGVSQTTATQLTYRHNRRSFDRNDAKPIDANALQPMDGPIDEIEEQYAHFAITRSLLKLVFRLVFKAIVAIYLRYKGGANATTTPSQPPPPSSSSSSTSSSSSSTTSEQCLPSIVSMVKQKLVGLDTKYCQINGEVTDTLASNTAAERSMHEIGLQSKCFAMADSSVYGGETITCSLSTPNIDATTGNGIAVQYCCNGDNKTISKPNGSSDIDAQIICDTSSSNHTSNGETNERTKGKSGEIVIILIEDRFS